MNKANVRNLITETSLVILLKLDSNHRRTFTFNGWPWKTIGHLFYAISSFVRYPKPISQFTGFTVRKQTIRVKIGDYLSSVTLNFDRWPWKNNRAYFYDSAYFVNHFIAMCEFKLELQSVNAQIGAKNVLTFDLHLWPLTLRFCMGIASANDTIPWKFDEETMKGISISGIKLSEVGS